MKGWLNMQVNKYNTAHKIKDKNQMITSVDEDDKSPGRS
jgi:hypothetical protein